MTPTVTPGTNWKPEIFKCSVCNKEFEENSILKKHVKEEDWKAVECKICPKFFNENYILEVLRKERKKEYKCSQFGKHLFLKY